MTEEKLQELERLAAEATPGPWEELPYQVAVSATEHVGIFMGYAGNRQVVENTRYIVEACNAMPKLTAALRAERARIQELERQAEWLARLAAMSGECFLAKCIGCEHRKNDLCGLDYYDMRDCILKVAKEGR